MHTHPPITCSWLRIGDVLVVKSQSPMVNPRLDVVSQQENTTTLFVNPPWLLCNPLISFFCGYESHPSFVHQTHWHSVRCESQFWSYVIHPACCGTSAGRSLGSWFLRRVLRQLFRTSLVIHGSQRFSLRHPWGWERLFVDLAPKNSSKQIAGYSTRNLWI